MDSQPQRGMIFPKELFSVRQYEHNPENIFHYYYVCIFLNVGLYCCCPWQWITFKIIGGKGSRKGKGVYHIDYCGANGFVSDKSEWLLFLQTV